MSDKLYKKGVSNWDTSRSRVKKKMPYLLSTYWKNFRAASVDSE